MADFCVSYLGTVLKTVIGADLPLTNAGMVETKQSGAQKRPDVC
jgi:hypothetical protein